LSVAWFAGPGVRPGMIFLIVVVIFTC